MGGFNGGRKIAVKREGKKPMERERRKKGWEWDKGKRGGSRLGWVFPADKERKERGIIREKQKERERNRVWVRQRERGIVCV